MRVWVLGAALAGVAAGPAVRSSRAQDLPPSPAPQTPQQTPAQSAPAQQPPAEQGSHGSCTMTDADGKVISLPECQNVSKTPRAETPQSKTAAQRFPYPGETPDTPPAQQGAQPAAGGAGETSPGTAAKRFPFPGDGSQPAGGAGAPGAGGPPLQDAGSSGESSSSSSSSESNAMKDLGPDQEENPYKADEDAARARAASRKSKREPPAAKPQTTEERVAEDLQVAGFYRDGGNFRGAYLRAKDAVTLAADDPEAHFLLAESARKLGKLDEAQNEYRETLKHDPVPKTKKAAEKAIKEMGGS